MIVHKEKTAFPSVPETAFPLNTSRKRHFWKKIIVFVLLLLLLFRGPIFRSAIHYAYSNDKTSYRLENEGLIAQCNTFLIENPTATPTDIIDFAVHTTAVTLSFSFDQCYNNPNQTAQTHRANCIGYAAMTDAIIQYIVKKRGISGQISSRSVVGQLYLFGYNMHRWTNNPFFHNHDYNQITDTQTGQIWAIDASVADVFWLNGYVR